MGLGTPPVPHLARLIPGVLNYSDIDDISSKKEEEESNPRKVISSFIKTQ